MTKRKTSIDKVAEFHEAFDAFTSNTPNSLWDNPNVLELRLNLMFEELSEFAIASGMLGYVFFTKLCHKFIETTRGYNEVSMVPDLNEMLDALCDMRVVNDGTILACGFQDIFDQAFDNVHKANMSKGFTDVQSAQKAADQQLTNNGTLCNIYRKSLSDGTPFAYLTRATDNKVLKSPNFVPPDHTKLIAKASQGEPVKKRNT